MFLGPFNKNVMLLSFYILNVFQLEKVCISIEFHLLTLLPYFNAELNKCQPNPCHNNAICNEVNNDFECVCSSEFTGKDCSSKRSSFIYS